MRRCGRAQGKGGGAQAHARLVVVNDSCSDIRRQDWGTMRESASVLWRTSLCSASNEHSEQAGP
jgi:hypothetical protein